MQIAITGGRGRLGSAIAQLATSQGHAVVCIDRTPPPDTETGARHVVANMLDFAELAACVQGCDALIHLAAYTSPNAHAGHIVYGENTTGSYNALEVAATLGITRVVMASSINAIGGAYSRWPRYDYFPLDEQHPCYAEDAYSLSKWVLEQQGDAFARRYEHMRIASLRFHWLVERAMAANYVVSQPDASAQQLWGYTQLSEASRACLLALEADFLGHEVFYIVAPATVTAQSSRELAARFFPETPIRGELHDNSGFFDCTKAEQLLGWIHSAHKV